MCVWREKCLKDAINIETLKHRERDAQHVQHRLWKRFSLSIRFSFHLKSFHLKRNFFPSKKWKWNMKSWASQTCLHLSAVIFSYLISSSLSASLWTTCTCLCNIDSMFIWRGKIRNTFSREFLLLFKCLLFQMSVTSILLGSYRRWHICAPCYRHSLETVTGMMASDVCEVPCKSTSQCTCWFLSLSVRNYYYYDYCISPSCALL